MLEHHAAQKLSNYTTSLTNCIFFFAVCVFTFHLLPVFNLQVEEKPKYKT